MTFTPLNLDIAKKVGNRKKVGLQYLKLGNGFLEISRFQKAIDVINNIYAFAKNKKTRREKDMRTENLTMLTTVLVKLRRL